eukprot:3873743-Amphidinium_carterae.1
MWGAAEEQFADENPMILLDCEGFGNTSSDKTRDAKLISLCLTLCSVFVLNTKGTLNESNFRSLSAVAALTDHVQGLGGDDISKPALLWLLRDFALELQDEAGKPMSSDEYLEASLHAKPLGRTE